MDEWDPSVVAIPALSTQACGRHRRAASEWRTSNPRPPSWQVASAPVSGFQ